MRIHYLKLRNMTHSLSAECFHCFQRDLLLYFLRCDSIQHRTKTRLDVIQYCIGQTHEFDSVQRAMEQMYILTILSFPDNTIGFILYQCLADLYF